MDNADYDDWHSQQPQDVTLIQFQWWSSVADSGADMFAGISSHVHVSFRRQTLTSKVDPRTVRVKLFLMAVDHYGSTAIRNNFTLTVRGSTLDVRI